MKIFRWIWQKISGLWGKKDEPKPIAARRLMPEDCILQGFTTLGNPIPPGSQEIIISSGVCRCRTPKFIEMVGYEADPVDANALIGTPVPFLLEDVRSEGLPARKPTIRSLDSGLACCLNWPAFSSIEECRLVLTVLNVLDVKIHVFGNLYVVCEGGCCDYRPPNVPPPPALASFSREGVT